MLLTYRSNITPRLPSTLYSSDAGWGCMLRVAQMLIANLLVRHARLPLPTVLPLFWDNAPTRFGIQTLTALAADIYPHKKPKDWFSPCEVAFVLQKALSLFGEDYSLVIGNDNSLFLSELAVPSPNLVIVILARIGLDQPESMYLAAVVEMMRSSFFLGVMGGTPGHALLFLKEREGFLGCLDPHQTRRAAESEEELLGSRKEYCGKLGWVRQEKISSSMGIAFVVERGRVGVFWEEMLGMK